MPGVKRARETSDESSEEHSLSKNNFYEWVRGPMLGRGGYGSVFLATVKRPKLCPTGTKIPKYVAVKSTWFHKAAELMRENQFLDLLKGCPYLVGYYGSDVTAYAGRGKFVYNVLLEYADGGALSDYIHLRCSEAQVSRYTEYLLKGIDYIHQIGFVHCDIKPENILMVASGYGYVPKLADFGLAKTVSSESSCRGTLVYMAPETVVSDIQEPPSDIWALGCVVINMLTGKRQWEASPSADLRQLVPLITGESPIPYGLSDVATDFLEKCLDRDPVKRFTAAQLLKHPFVTQHREVESSLPKKSVSLLDKYPNFIPLDSLSSEEEDQSSLLADYSEIHPVKLMFPWRKSIPASSAASAVLDAA